MEKEVRKQNDDVESEEWCFVCHDGGKLRECDYPKCGKAYHYKCVGQKRSFLASNANWICTRHSCSSCGGKPKITCYCCPIAICHQCIDAAEFFPIRGEHGFCNDCMNFVLHIEGIMESDSNVKRKLVDFSKQEIYLEEYYEIIKKQEGITSDDLQSAKGQWKIREKRKSGISVDDVDENKRHKVLPKINLDSNRTSFNDEVVSNAIATPFASIVPENIRLVYLRRSLVEKLLKQPESFEDKVKGTFVRVELPSNDVRKRKAHQLVQVTGTTSDQDGMAVKLQASNIPNDISIHTLSDADLFEEDCEDLRQQMQSGLLRRPTVEELEKKGRILHEDMVDDLIAKELRRLQPRIDQANEMGRRQEFFAYLSRKKQLEAPSERLRLIHKLPVVIAEDVLDVNALSKGIADDGEGNKGSPESIPIKDSRLTLNVVVDDKKQNEGFAKLILNNKCKGSGTTSDWSLFKRSPDTPDSAQEHTRKQMNYPGSEVEPGKETITSFNKSHVSEEDIIQLLAPMYSAGCTEALEEVKAKHLPGLDLSGFPMYDPNAKEKADILVKRMCESGIQVDHLVSPEATKRDCNEPILRHSTQV